MVAGAALVVLLLLLLAEPILPPAVVLVLTVLELLLWEEIVLQLQWGFHVSTARLKQQSGTTQHPSKGVMGHDRTGTRRE